MGRPRDKLVELHPFGQLLESKYKKNGCSQASLATASRLKPAILSQMAVGNRLTRENVLKCIEGFTILGFLEDADEANFFLEEASFDEKTREEKLGFERLNVGNWRDRQLLELINKKARERKIAFEKPKYGKRLIGRDRAEKYVCDLLRKPDTRLLTLTGAAGIGKTSLAENVADALNVNDNPVFTDGVFFIYLDTISEPDKDKIVTAIARGFGLEDTKIPLTLERLKEYLRDKHLLLVLDSCERLIQECAELAGRLLRSCKQIKMLATSTELLGIDEEHAWPVPPLQYPDPYHLPSIDRTRKYSAIQLFELSRKKRDPEFTVTDENASAIAQICAYLDGHTLAIKLAAGRATRSVWEIAEYLDNCLALLFGGSRTGPQRHMTIREAIKWSYDPLPEDEKLLLKRLSVFRGGWTLFTAAATCAGDGIEFEKIEKMVDDLASKSLVEVKKHGKLNRNSLLEIVRQFALNELDQAGELDKIKERHLLSYLLLVDKYVPDIPGSIAEKWFNILAIEHDNLRAVMEWCLEGKVENSVNLLLHFATVLGGIWLEIGNWKEALLWLMIAIAQADKTGDALIYTEEYAEALSIAGECSFYQFNIDQASSLLEKSITLYRELGKEDVAKKLQAFRGTIQSNLNDHKEGILSRMAYLEDQIASQSTMKKAEASVDLLLSKGHLAQLEGRYEEARILIEQALNLSITIDNQPLEGICIDGLGHLAFSEEKYDVAANFFKKSLVVNRGYLPREYNMGTLEALGFTLLYLDHVNEAMEYFMECFELSLTTGSMPIFFGCLLGLAELARRKEQWQRAACLFAKAKILLKTLEEFKISRASTAATRFANNSYTMSVHDVHGHLGEEAFGQAVFKGLTMEPQEVINYVREQKLEEPEE